MGRKALPTAEKRTQQKLRMTALERARADRLATRWGCSLNEAINRAVALADSQS